MYSKIERLVRAGVAIGVLLATLAAPKALAQSCGTLPCSFEGTAVVNSNSNVDSSTDFMISYRDELHSWQTSDGQTHYLINTGSGSGRGLQIWTRYVDKSTQVVTWVSGPLLPQTSSSNTNALAATSTADGRLTTDSSGNTTLAVVYSTTLTGSDPSSYSGGNIAYMLLDYAPQSMTSTTTGWTLDPTVKASTALQKVYNNVPVTDGSGNTTYTYALNPTLAIDTTQAATNWVAFTLTQCPYYNSASPATTNCLPSSTIKLVYLNSSATKWVDTNLQFGPTDGNFVTEERTARLVATSNAVGMIYQAHQSFFWTYRINGANATTAWSAPLPFFTSAPMMNSGSSFGAPYDNNPYASHFSALSDTDNPKYVANSSNPKIHMVTVDHSRLFYFPYGANASGGWGNPVTLLAANQGPGGTSTSASYPQIFFAPLMNSSTNQYLAAVVNNSDVGNVFQSTNDGQNWSAGAILNHDNVSSPTASFSNPRFEVPQAIVTADVPLVQQYVDSSASTYDNFLLDFDLTGLVN